MGNHRQSERHLRHRIDSDTIFDSNGFAQLVCDGGGQRVTAFFFEKHRAACGIQLSREGLLQIDGSPVFLKRPYHRIGAKVLRGKLHRHSHIGMSGFWQRECRRHQRVDTDRLLMDHCGAPAVFCCGNEGDVAGLREFHLAAVCGQRAAHQLGKLGGKSVSKG